MKLKVYSEIGKLKKVLVHRPGKEVQRLYPEIFEKMLFDDIMYLKAAQEEHDYFVSKLKKEGVEVFYIEKLVAEVIGKDKKLREKFIEEYLDMAFLRSKSVRKAAKVFLESIKDPLELVKTAIAGIKKSEISPKFDNSLNDIVIKNDDYPFYIDPIPNILFQRDPTCTIFDGMNFHKMSTDVRRREYIFLKYGLRLHPKFKNTKAIIEPSHEGTIEGGDILVISKEVIFIGISERTTAKGVECLAKKLFKHFSHLKWIVAIEIPRAHATMHLDTILTQMDYDKFSVDAEMAREHYKMFILKRKTEEDFSITEVRKNIKEILKEFVNPQIKLIVVGEGERVRAKSEQWNDGANCLCIEPGKIIVYNRNIYTNKAIEESGVKTIKIKSSELSRGRGGPRCMTMPLEREELK